MDTNTITPLRDDVLIKKTESVSKESEIIFVPEDRNDSINFFEVVNTGPDCVHLKKGDTIGLKHLQHTVPIEIDGVKYAAVSEKDVEFVIED